LVVEAQAHAHVRLPDLSIRTALRVVEEVWRIARSDGTDVEFALPHALLRHEATGRVGDALIRATASVAGVDATDVLGERAVTTLTRRLSIAAHQAAEVAAAPLPPSGPCRILLDYALAKGLAHEAIGHLCEADVDGSVLMRGGRLRIGERLSRPTGSVGDGPLAGGYADQPWSANGLPRETVPIVKDGVLASGLGDLFSAEAAGIPITGACRAASFRDRPTPRMTNIRIVVRDPLPLDVEPEALTPEAVAQTARHLGVVDSRVPTLYLAGYRGGQAQPRRGDFIFAADAVYELTSGAAPRHPASFTGLAEKALAAIVAGIGPLRLDATGTCVKDGSSVTSSGGSHALLVLYPDPDLVVSASR